MRTRSSIWLYVFLGLIAIGLLASLQSLLIPIVVLGVIFLLYKFPPSKWKKSMRRNHSNSSRYAERYVKPKPSSHLRVIPGNKKEDEPPTSH
jgi:hypothetical protein